MRRVLRDRSSASTRADGATTPGTPYQYSEGTVRVSGTVRSPHDVDLRKRANPVMARNCPLPPVETQRGERRSRCR
jgi:hypothetical protein